jgi:hypothetical protein
MQEGTATCHSCCDQSDEHRLGQFHWPESEIVHRSTVSKFVSTTRRVQSSKTNTSDILRHGVRVASARLECDHAHGTWQSPTALHR